MANVSTPKEIFSRYVGISGGKMKPEKRIAIELLGRDVRRMTVDLRVDFFEKYTKKTKKDLNSKQQLQYFCYLIAVATAYKYCMYPDLVTYGYVQERMLAILDIRYRSEMAKIIGRRGLFDKVGLLDTISYEEAPILQCYREYYRGEEDDIFKYVKEYKYLVDTKPNIRTEIMKKPLFCMQRRVTNKNHYLGSFYDSTYTRKIKLNNILHMIHADGLKADVVGFYYYILLESIRLGKRSLRFSNEHINKTFNLTNPTIKKYLEQLESAGYIKTLRHGRTGADRIIHIVKMEG